MKQVLVLFAHPAFEKSRVNKQLVKDIKSIEGITFHDLYEAYPDHDIDIDYEKKLLLEHDIIIFHHPFFWYSTPPILKEWQDLVLEHGWAYGSEGNMLKGKIFFNIITTGAQFSAYNKDGYNRFTIRQLIAPIEQTAFLCKMVFLPPFVIHGALTIKDEEIKKQKELYLSLLEQIRREEVDLTQYSDRSYLNECLAEMKEI